MHGQIFNGMLCVIVLGKLTSNDANCKVSLNSLFGRHCAIVGTTGGGKSWAVAKLVHEVVTKTNNKVILIDATGEYSKVTSNSLTLGSDAYFHFNVYQYQIYFFY